MRRRLKAFTLIELLVVIAIIALLISILLPSLSRARELSKRLVCASNVKGVGTSAKIYANDNGERWMVPPFKRANIDEEGIDYVKDDESFTVPPSNEGEVGWNREYESTSETPSFPNEGSSQVSVTRAYWMMVRSGDITVKQYVCTSSGDSEDVTENLDLYYDFENYENISYGYQVPFGPRDTRPREGMDNRQIVAADKSPYYIPTYIPDWNVGNQGEIDTDDSPKTWRPFNSFNHGGTGNGEGQNCLYADGHASFNRTPAVGIDNDNIYTVMTEEWGTAQGFNRIHGDTVHTSPITYPYPGQDAYGQGANMFASTDTLIYP
ncbi:MAG: prepilin-type N-terminal cleavage/methylation domain-containing protein [Phycisphaerales bacterium]|nr:MAG: prepilin-type N-terminal cleavage/methylation domain-containing protein [Phycisphaerales bacterium]